MTRDFFLYKRLAKQIYTILTESTMFLHKCSTLDVYKKVIHPIVIKLWMQMGQNIWNLLVKKKCLICSEKRFKQF